MRSGGLSINIIFWSCFNGLTFYVHHVLNLKYCSLTFSSFDKFKIFEINLLKHCTSCINRRDSFSCIMTKNIPAAPTNGEYIYISVDILQFVVLFVMSLIEGSANKEWIYWTKGSKWLCWYQHIESVSHHHDVVNRFNVSVSQITSGMFRSS